MTTATLAELTSGEAYYWPCDARDIPESIRWDTPRANQGQIVEVQYGVPDTWSSPAGPGDPYKRVIDHSLSRESHYRLVKMVEVVTYEVPRGNPHASRLAICTDCADRFRARGTWPKDAVGREYVNVYRGAHLGFCSTCGRV